MEVRSATATGSDNFARLSNDLIAYRSSESEAAAAEVNGDHPSPLFPHHHRMHPLTYDDGRYTSTTSNGRAGHDASSRASTMRNDRRYTTGGSGAMDPGIGGGGAGDSVRLRPQLLQGQEARNPVPVPVSSGPGSTYSSSSRRLGQNRPNASGEVRTSCLVKSKSGFGFTMADAPTGHVVKLMSEALGHGQLQPGDVIVMVDGVDVRRQSHENTVAMLKSYRPGSTVVFSYIRPNGNRNPSHHPRPHSAVPKSSLHSAPSTFLPMNGGGGARAGMDKMGVTEEENTFDHRTINHRPPTNTHPEVNPGGLNGTAAAAPAASFHHSRTVSFDSSVDTSEAAMKTRNGSSSRDGEPTKGRRSDSRRLTGILRRAVGPRRRVSTPVVEGTQGQRLMMDPTASISTLNFSGTPDFIPASLYRPSFSNSEYAELVENYQTTTNAVDGAASAGYVDDRLQQTSRANSNEATHRPFRSAGPSSISSRDQWSEASNDRTTSLVTESKNHQSKTSTTRKSFDNDNRLQQMTIGNRPHPLYPSQSLHRSANGRRDSSIRNHSGDVNLKADSSSVIESVDPSSVFNADIHRGSRGFGFSIRGGKEFNGMPLLVLNIAEGGPADMDGRMKNGDEILSINGFSTRDMTHERAIELIQNACSPISLVMKRTTASSNAKRQTSRPAKVGDAGQTRKQP